MLQSILKVIRGIVKLRGNTDNTLVGNVGDRLKVDALISDSSHINKKFRVDFNTTTQVVTNPNYSTIYSYSGTGKFWGFYLDTSQDETKVRLTIDSQVIFADITVKQLRDANMEMTPDGWFNGDFLKSSAGRAFVFTLPFPITYSSTVLIEATRNTSGTSDIRRTLVYIVKDT